MTEEPQRVAPVRTADPALLLDLSRCPACFEPLGGTRCGRCGLDVSVEGGPEVYAASQAVVRALEDRDRRIEAMRARQEERDRAGVPAAPAMAPPPPPAMPTPVPPTDPSRPRRSGVQILLLVAGVTAVSVAAVVFALVAVLLASPAVRTGVLAVIGAGVLGGAVVLRRRLPATAEAITVVGLVVLLLDLVLLRTGDLLGLGDTDALVYTGAGLAVVAAAGALLGRRADLRAGSFAAVFLLPAAALLVVAGVADGSGWATSTWLAGLAGAVVALVAAFLAAGAPESAALRVQALLATLIALIAAASALPGAPVMRLATEGAVALLAVADLLALRRRPLAGARVDAAGATAVGAAAAALGLLLAFGTGTTPLVGAIDLAPIALVVPLACTVLLMARPGLLGRPASIAGIAAGGLVGLPPAVPLLVGSGEALGALLAAPGPFPADPGWPTPASAAEVGVAVLGSTALLAAAAVIVRRRWPAVAAGLVLGSGAVAAAVATGSSGAVLAVAVPVGGLAVAAAGALGRRATVPATGLLAVAIGAIALVAPRSTVLWPFAALSGLVLLAVAAAVAEAGPRRTGTVAVAAAFLVAMGSFTVPWASAVGWSPLDAAPPASVPFVVCCLLLALGGLSRARLPGVERLAVQSVAVLGGAGAGAVLAGAPQPGAAAGGAIGLALAAVGAVAIARGTRSGPDLEAEVAAALGPLLITGAFAAATDAVPDAPSLLVPVAAAAGTLLAALLDVATIARTRTVVVAWEGSLAVAAVATAGSALASTRDAWLPLVLTAMAVMTIAVGEPLRSRARRIAAAWGAFGLATAALWQALSTRSIGTVEPYTLPPALVLIAVVVVGALRRPSAADAGRTALGAAGLALAIAPSGIAAAVSGGARSIVVAVVAGGLVLAATVLPPVVRGSRVDGVLVGVGVPVLTVVAIAESMRAERTPETWWVPAGVVLLGCAVALARSDRSRIAMVPATGGSLAVAAVAATPSAGPARIAAALTLLAIAHVALVAQRGSRPLVPAVPIAAAALAALVAAAAVRPLEAATAPVAVGLIGSGLIRMARDPAVRSWPALGPGLGVLLLPSLALDLLPAATWRVVALGVVALAVLVAGAATRTSAPFLLGGGVFVVHVLAQLQPWVVRIYASVDWWVWMAAAGVLLIALGARYEQRVRNLKQAVRLLSAQR